jgi:O-antigen ligase
VLAVGAVAFTDWTLRPGRATVNEALSVRWHLAIVSLRVAATDPLLGVGAGRLHAASAPYIPPDLTAMYPPAAAGENAHNNFLQVLAESGLLGFIAFLWLLAAATGPPSRWRAPDMSDGLAPGLVGGFVAFLLTCLAGHPLLIEYVRTCFFLWAGLSAARLAPPDPSSPGRTWSARFLAAALALIAILVPLRVAAARQTGRVAMLSERGATPADSVRGHRPDGARNARRIRARAGGGGGAGPAGA